MSNTVLFFLLAKQSDCLEYVWYLHTCYTKAFKGECAFSSQCLVVLSDEGVSLFVVVVIAVLFCFVLLSIITMCFL